MRHLILIDALVMRLVSAADRLDEAAGALRAAHKGVTLTSRILQGTATALGATAVPVILLDVLLGGPARRAELSRSVPPT